MGEVAGGIMSAGGIMIGALGRSSARKQNAKVMQLKAAAGRAAATQTDAAYREQLDTTLANIDAIRTGQNADISSPTSRALRKEAKRRSGSKRTVAVANARIGARQHDIDAAGQKRLAKIDLISGGVSAMTKLMQSSNAAARAMAGLGG